MKPRAELRCLPPLEQVAVGCAGPRMVGKRAATTTTVCEDEQTKLINVSLLKASQRFLRELMFLLN